MPVIPRDPSRQRAAGFTLPELVVTMIVIGILAAVAVPRFMTRSEFDVFGVTEQTRAALRFAQKSAIAKRRNVCVSIAASSLSLTFGRKFNDSCSDPTTCAASPTTCLSLSNPATGQGYTLPATSGISIDPASFSFNALGRPSAPQTLIVGATGGSYTQTIKVEAETGYVH